MFPNTVPLALSRKASRPIIDFWGLEGEPVVEAVPCAGGNHTPGEAGTKRRTCETGKLHICPRLPDHQRGYWWDVHIQRQRGQGQRMQAIAFLSDAADVKGMIGHPMGT